MQAIQKIINSKNCSVDSRTLKEGDIFFDLGSGTHNYGKYFTSAVKKKPLLIITQKKKIDLLYKKKVFIVKNIYSFYTKSISQKFKKKPKYSIAVTGTNGKSSIAFFYYKILLSLGYKVGSIGTLGIFENKKKKNSDLTTPSFLDNHKTLNNFYKKKINHAIIEASSHGLKQSRLNSINFYSGIFTNLTHDHLDYHLTMRDYLESKLILFNKLIKKKGFIITGSDIPEFSILKKISKKNKIKFLSYGANGNTIKIISFKALGKFTNLKINVLGKIFILKLNLIGKFQIENFLSAVLACYSCGIGFERIFQVCSKVKNPPGRMELIKKFNKIIIIDYAHTPDALKKTINEVRNFFKREVNVVFGCGGGRDKSKRKIMGKIADKLCKKIYITNDNPRQEDPSKIISEIKKGCPAATAIQDRGEAIKKAIHLLKEEVLLIAGKGHENYQISKNQRIAFSDRITAISCLR
jgi:UDP-N-acetylmuramyl-tripeptide synthetase